MEYTKRWAPEHWHLAFQGNVHSLNEADFDLIETSLKGAAVPGWGAAFVTGLVRSERR